MFKKIVDAIKRFAWFKRNHVVDYKGWCKSGVLLRTDGPTITYTSNNPWFKRTE